MSRFWPHAEYAEDQRYGKTILTVHVLDRGMQTGTVLGMDAGLALVAYQRWQLGKTKSIGTIPGGGGASSAFATGTHTSGMTNPLQMFKKILTTPAPVMRTITNSAGIGALGGLVMMTVMLPVYMRGKTHVEWQDRSWRLLANGGQVEVDDWSLVGALAGAGTSFVPRLNRGGFTYLNLLGRGSVGAMVGVVGYMGWRYGVMGGKRDNVVAKDEQTVNRTPIPA